MSTTVTPADRATRQHAMRLAMQYLHAPDQRRFVQSHSLNAGCLALRYAALLPDLMQRMDTGEAQAHADAMVFGLGHYAPEP